MLFLQCCFQKDPAGFLKEELPREQCIHFLTMLEACWNTPDNAALAAFLITRWLREPSEEFAAEMDAFFGWNNGSDEERLFTVGQDIRELVSTWRCNYRKCRNAVKSEWELYEEAYNHVIAENVIPDDLRHFAEILDDSAFVEDPIDILRGMDRTEQERFVVFCGALNGKNERDSAVFAGAALTWLENPFNDEARQLMHRIGGWRAAGVSEEIAALRDFFEKAAVSWKFNYGGLRNNAVTRRNRYFSEFTKLRGEKREEGFEQEFRSYDRIMEDEGFLDHPCRYLRRMNQLQCERFLLFMAAFSGMEPDSALRFAVVFKNMIFYPNDGLRKRVDMILGRISPDDRQRTAYIEELLSGSAKEFGQGTQGRREAEQNWGTYAKVFDDYHERQKKNHWELNEQNVKKLFRYLITNRENTGTVKPGDDGTIVVRLLGEEEPIGYSFRDVALNSERIFSEQAGEILRFMLGQLEMFHLRGENKNQRTYPVTYPVEMVRTRRNAYGEKIEWTQSESTVCQLLYMAVGAELLPPLYQTVNKRTQEVRLIIKLDEKGADKIETILRS